MYKWLKDYQNLSNEIEYLEFNIDRYETELKRWVEGDPQDVHLNERSKASQLEEIIQENKKVLEMKEDQREHLIKLIDRFKGLDNQMLKMKYVDGMTLEVIAEELNYSSSYIYKRHAEIIRMIKFAEKT